MGWCGHPVGPAPGVFTGQSSPRHMAVQEQVGRGAHTHKMEALHTRDRGAPHKMKAPEQAPPLAPCPGRRRHLPGAMQRPASPGQRVHAAVQGFLLRHCLLEVVWHCKEAGHRLLHTLPQALPPRWRVGAGGALRGPARLIGPHLGRQLPLWNPDLLASNQADGAPCREGGRQSGGRTVKRAESCRLQRPWRKTVLRSCRGGIGAHVTN